MRLRCLGLVATVLVVAGCGADKQPDTPPAASSPAGAPSSAPQFTYPDITQGDSTAFVKLYSYDAGQRSAVVEPIIFMTGLDFCKKYRINKNDPQCNNEWITEDSHLKVTVPVVARPALLTWDDGEGGVCIDSPTSGGRCPTSASKFAAWLAENPEGLVKITVKDGTATRLAQMYTP